MSVRNDVWPSGAAGHDEARLVDELRENRDHAVDDSDAGGDDCVPDRRGGSVEGLDHEGVATFDHLAVVPTSVLAAQLGRLGVGGRQ